MYESLNCTNLQPDKTLTQFKLCSTNTDRLETPVVSLAIPLSGFKLDKKFREKFCLSPKKFWENLKRSNTVVAKHDFQKNFALITFCAIRVTSNAKIAYSSSQLTKISVFLPSDMSTLSTVDIFVAVVENFSSSWPKDAGKPNFRFAKK